MSHSRLCIERGPGQKISYLVNFIDGIVADKVSENYIYWKSFECFHCYEHKKLLTNSSKSTVKTNHSYSFFGLSFVGHLAQLYILMNVMVQYLFKIQVSRRMILCDSYI